MKFLRVVCALFVFFILSSGASAQTVEIEDPAQMTFYAGGYAAFAVAASNGTEWGVLYAYYDGAATVRFLRCTIDGILLGGQQLYGDPDEIIRYSYPTISAYPYGWAITYEYLMLRSDDDYKFKQYFATLDKFGRKTGFSAVVCEDIGRWVTKPIWVDPMFIVFYPKETSTGYFGVHAAYFDRKAKRIRPDVVITKPLGRNHYIELAIPTSEGIALFGRTFVGEKWDTTFYLLVDLDGTPITDLVYLDNNGEDFYTHEAIWTGDKLAIAGIEEYVDFSKASPFSRLLTTSGNWSGALLRHTENNSNRHFGIAWDGTRFLSAALNFYNGTTMARQANSKMQKVGQSIFVDDSTREDVYSRISSNGSTAALFHCAKKAGTVGSADNIYFQRIVFPHSGKPEVKYFNGKVHEFDGKKYVLFDWLVAGCDQITMKTKGGRWKLPATGFHAVEVDKKAKFKIVASNKAGNAKAKLKITP